MSLKMFSAFYFGLLTGMVCGHLESGGKGSVPEVSRKCLDCICQATSECTAEYGCDYAGPDAFYCGPYRISLRYWHDSGRPQDKGRPSDAETCLTDKACAERSVRGYMKIFGKDCDKDGSISCYDFGRIHLMGPDNCALEMNKSAPYWQRFEACYGDAPDAMNLKSDSFEERE